MFKLWDGEPREIVVTPSLEQHELRSLLASLRKSIELWFLTNRDDAEGFSSMRPTYEASFYQIQTTTAAIIQHGLRPARKLQSVHEATAVSPIPTVGNDELLQKLIDDFEWVRRSAQIRDSPDDDVGNVRKDVTHSSLSPFAGSTTATATTSTVEQFLLAWILKNLKANCLCSCLQALVADKELLESYYCSGAFLRNETYSTALFICLSALELKQCSLLSQVEPSLYRSIFVVPAVAKHRRSSSHPNFYISPNSKVIDLTEVDGPKPKHQKIISTPAHKISSPRTFSTFRRVKSVPVLLNNINNLTDNSVTTRPRSQTMTTKKSKIIAIPIPKSIPKPYETPKLNSDLTLAIASPSSSFSGDDTQPSTSAASKISIATSSVSNSSNISGSSTNTACRINLIKCDDIKIWTDQNWESRQKQQESQQQSTPKHVTESCKIPKIAKSISPINSFLSSLFNTPPAYTNWSINQRASNMHNDSSEANAYPCNPCHDLDASSSSGVFDSFLPKYGQKLRSRNSQNLFEDGIPSLDQKYYDCAPSVTSDLNAGAEDANCSSSGVKRVPKNCQSLTTFLQMAQLSRNNTELEKENAHFRISEAIISAIEHIKWAKLEPDKWRRENETKTAMDWLESEQKSKSDLNNKETESEYLDSDEHIPYAELGESCLDLISAEVVGLCLISKFNERHLPKVSELKWLVSEEDTPQNLLPMPDNSSSENPDDNIMPSVTRGTKYWAPPRQQIIFTDHPPPNRKELIQKQNNRCAGCGMRVSPQYISSFRYCTYLGKYHCTGCHRNQISATPAKILNMWDFKCYPVSVFAYRLLEQMYTYPLFYVPDLNPVLYTRCKRLLSARTKRVQLRFVKDFIKTCRFATIEQQYFESIPDYICADPDTWSMSDFIDANNKSIHRYIEEVILKCENHIFNCVLCTARGFICEQCRKEEIVYPWQHNVFRCDRCGACFHQNCWKSMMENCCRCQRIKSRQEEISEIMLNSY